MTSRSPRIYIYKITFDEVLYYYYGVHKEKRFNEDYWGSPVANKWCWELYTPQKQILEIFDYTDDGWLEAEKVEKRLIRPFFNTDKWCLNESCGGIMSLKQRKKNGLKAKENKTGIFAMSPERVSQVSKSNALQNQKNKVGIFSLTFEERSENSKKTAIKNVENKVGLFSQNKDQLIENCKKGGKKCKELCLGVFSQTKEQMRQNGKKTNAQRWECLETGYVSTPSGLSQYQKARNIDTSKRKRIE